MELKKGLFVQVLPQDNPNKKIFIKKYKKIVFCLQQTFFVVLLIYEKKQKRKTQSDSSGQPGSGIPAQLYRIPARYRNDPDPTN